MTSFGYNILGFGGGVAADVDVNAVTFDASNDYLEKTSNFSSVSDGKLLTVSMWININAITGSFVDLITFGDIGIRNNLKIRVNGVATKMTFDLDATTSGSSDTAVTFTADTAFSTSTWHHILISIDTANQGGSKFYIDDVDDSPTFSNFNNKTIPWTNIPDNRVAGDLQITPTTSTLFNGDMAEVWIDYSYLDLSNTSNRRKFITSTGKPASMNADGSAPTGSAPTLYLSGATASWHTNKGGGGGMTEVGALTTASTSPSD